MATVWHDPLGESVAAKMGGETIDRPEVAVAAGDQSRFAEGMEAWRQGLGRVRDVVHQELVVAQVLSHLGVGGERGGAEVLDVGCGQGTVAIALAQAGHRVVGIDVSERLLAEASNARRRQPDEVEARVVFLSGDLDDLDPAFGSRFDMVCCHGLLMYLPSLADGIAKLARAVRPGGMLSVLTCNQASPAMRAAVRADRPEEVAAVVARAGASVVAAYGLRLFTDRWSIGEPPADLDGLLAVEAEAARRDPYRQVAALTHTVAMRAPAAASTPVADAGRSARGAGSPAVLNDPGVAVSDAGELLVGYLASYRRAIDRKLEGLTETQLHSIVAPLGWAPLGLVQHLGWVERRWIRWGFAAEDVVAWHPDGDDAEWVVAADAASSEVRAAYAAEVNRSIALITGTPIDERAAVGGRFPTAEEAPTLGRILFHLLQEYARHAGHLDIARELIDGVTGE